MKKLIAGPGVYICDECINLCNEIIQEELGRPGRKTGVSDVPAQWEAHLEHVPVCPNCRSALEESAAYRVLDVRDDAGGEARRALILFCRWCGLTIDDLILEEPS